MLVARDRSAATRRARWLRFVLAGLPVGAAAKVARVVRGFALAGRAAVPACRMLAFAGHGASAQLAW